MPSSDTGIRFILSRAACLPVALSATLGVLAGGCEPQVHDSATPAGTSTTIDDSGRTNVLKVDGGQASVPPESFEPGTTVSVSETQSPEKFKGNEEVAPASAALQFAAKDSTGNEVKQAVSPFTLAIGVSEEAAAALTGVEKSWDNLCAFGFTTDLVWLVWRHKALKEADEAKGVASFDAKWSGVYQLWYCGDVALPEAFEVSPDGAAVSDQPATGTGTGTSTSITTGSGSCHFEDAGYCTSYLGTGYAASGALDNARAQCQAGTWAENGSCPSEGVINRCVYFAGTADEYAIEYYDGFDHPIDTLSANCQLGGAQWK